MDPLVWIREKFGVGLHGRFPIELPDSDRDYLARMFHVFEFTSGAEIGVERGAYSEAICQGNPGVRLLCVDAWRAYRGYRDHVNQARLDGFFEEATARLKPYRATLVRKFSVDAARDVPNGSLDFVYLDGNHAIEHVIADLAAWSPKVRVGGIVSGHDFARHRWPDRIHVVPAVHAWTQAYEIEPWFVLGREEKVPGERRDDSRSWFYVQPEPRKTRAGRRPVRQ